jgi:amino acid transporter
MISPKDTISSIRSLTYRHQISKIFPRPPLLFACSFAWVFVSFSTSVGNALNFAKFLLLTRNNNPGEWLEKFIACGIVFVISLLHYRTVNIGVYANNILAVGKVLFLLVLVLAGFIGVSRDGHNDELLGLPRFAETSGKITSVNVVVAILLVFYSYQGWENASKLANFHMTTRRPETHVFRLCDF